MPRASPERPCQKQNSPESRVYHAVDSPAIASVQSLFPQGYHLALLAVAGGAPNRVWPVLRPSTPPSISGELQTVTPNRTSISEPNQEFSLTNKHRFTFFPSVSLLVTHLKLHFFWTLFLDGNRRKRTQMDASPCVHLRPFFFLRFWTFLDANGRPKKKGREWRREWAYAYVQNAHFRPLFPPEHIQKRPFAFTCVHFRPFSSIVVHFRPLASILVHIIPFASSYLHLRPLASICVHLRPFWSTCVHFSSFASTLSTFVHFCPFYSTCVHFRPF